MITALKNLAIVTAICLICLLGTWLYLRNSSLAQPVKRAHEHPFLQTQFPASIAYGEVAPTAFPERHADFEKWAKLPKSVIVWLPVSLNNLGELQVIDKSAGTKTLADAIRFFADRRMILSFLENRPGTAPRILEVLDAAKADDRILIHSPIDGTLKELREKRPRWLFGTSLALSTRLKMMASIGLEAAVPIENDILVIEQLPKRLSEASEEIIKDAHRRNLRVIAGPIDTAEEAKSLFERKVDGVMITNLEVLAADPASTFVR